MSSDLGREEHKIVAHLEIESDENVFCDLLKAASFGVMKAQAVSLVPGTDAKLWKSNAQFFAKGKNGQWKERWSRKSIVRFEALFATYASDYID